MKKLDNIIMAVIVALATYYIAPIFIIAMVIHAIRGCIECRTMGFLKDWAKLMLATGKAWAKMIGRIAENGLIKDAMNGFYEEIETC